jgi:Ca2+-binding RTX toxin-like protein
VTLAGAADVTVFVGGVAEDTIRNIEDLAGGSGADTLTGDNFRNFLYGAGGNDTLAGGNGNDQLMGGAGKDTLDGNAGVDTADYSDQTRSVAVVLAGAGNANVKINGIVEDTIRNIENVQGGTAGDTLSGDGLDNILAGGAGDDTLRGGAGADVLDGEDGSDTADYGDKTTGVRATLKGASNSTVSIAGVVEDTIRGIENLIGGSAADTLTGDGLDNRLVGGSGDDTLQGGAGKDALDGGDGIDTADYRDKSDPITVTLRGASTATAFVGGVAEDTLRNVENLFGGSGQDGLTGDTFANMLNGGGDNDSLAGAAGDDVLIGGSGSDVLAGGAGNDSLTGGVGLDGFLFDAALNATTNLDTVADFNVADDFDRPGQGHLPGLRVDRGDRRRCLFRGERRARRERPHHLQQPHRRPVLRQQRHRCRRRHPVRPAIDRSQPDQSGFHRRVTRGGATARAGSAAGCA